MIRLSKPAPVQMLRLGEVAAMVGLSKQHVRKMATEGKFPSPVKVGERAIAWPQHAVQAWLRERIAASQ